MKTLIFIFLCFAITGIENRLFSQDADESVNLENGDETTEETRIYYNINPKLGLTFFSNSEGDVDVVNLQWLSGLNFRFGIEGRFFQFNSSLNAIYGQQHAENAIPEKTQDNFILSLTPSISLTESGAIRLFLETTAETEMGKGYIDDRQTDFMDPLFLYQTLFLGQKQFIVESTDSTLFEVTYGVGYAFQQTLTKNFQPDTLQASDNTNFESGFSAIFQINMELELIENVNYKLDLKGVAFSKKDFFNDVKSSRATLLVGSGLYYKFFGIEYNCRLVYDVNYSARRQLQQSLLFSLNL